MATRPSILWVPLCLLAGCAEDGPAEPVATQDVTIPGRWVFEPEAAQVQAGEPVTWTNRGGAAHTVTFEGLGIDETLDPGEAFTHTFLEPGTYRYTCTLHPPDMEGTLVVVASGEG